MTKNYVQPFETRCFVSTTNDISSKWKWRRGFHEKVSWSQRCSHVDVSIWKSMVMSYKFWNQVLESYKFWNQNASHLDLEIEARKFSNKFSDNLSLLFPSQMLFIKTSFKKKIAYLKSAKEMASFWIVENASLATTYPDVCVAYMMYCIWQYLQQLQRKKGLFLNSN